jgi:phosphohistidine phosphatase
MKTILIMRHAKSDWGEQYATDIERPLNPRGLRDALRMAAFLDTNDLLPQIIISSPARRAQMTATFISRHQNFIGELRLEQRAYLASDAMLLEIISELPDTAANAMLIGHNPSMEDLVQRLTGANVRMPTAAIARVRLSIDNWARITQTTGLLQWLIRPKLLRK